MKLTRLQHHVIVAIPFCYITFLLFGVIGVFTAGDVGHLIIIATVLIWILNKMISEAFTALDLWHKMSAKDKQ